MDYTNITRDVSRFIDQGYGFMLPLTSGEQEVDIEIRESVCDNPECECRDMQLVLKPIGDSAWAEPTPTVQVVVNIDTGELVDISDGCTQSLRESFESALEGPDLMPCLRERWRRIKLLCDPEAWRKQDWSWWKPGFLIRWQDAFPGEFDKLIVVDDVRYMVDDMYCSGPLYRCKEVTLVFTPVKGVKEANQQLKSVQLLVDLWKWNVVGENGNPLNTVQAAFWKAYTDLLPDAKKLLRKRNAKIRKIGRELHRLSTESSQMPLQKATGKTGRNSPCSCTSGKKYKKSRSAVVWISSLSRSVRRKIRRWKEI